MILHAAYARTPNEIFARHALSIRKQQPEESLDEYLQALKSMSKDCNFRQVTSVEYCNEAVRDTFIRGLLNGDIRQRLLENETLNLQTAFAQAKALDTAQRNAECYRTQVTAKANLAPAGRDSTQDDAENHFGCATQSAKKTKCYFYGFNFHLRFKCPAREATCHKCKKKGHYQRVCQSKTSPDPVTAAMHAPLFATTTLQGVPTVLRKSSISVIINDYETKALVDSGSTDSFIHPRLVKACSLFVRPSAGTISLAADTLTAKILGHCAADIKVDSRTYPDVKLHVFPNLCADLIFGQNWQSKHESVTIDYGGDQLPVKICNLTTLDVSPPSLFQHLSQDCKPIAIKSRRYSHEDQEFIENETKRLLDEGIVEPSDSP